MLRRPETPRGWLVTAWITKEGKGEIGATSLGRRDVTSPSKIVLMPK